MYKVVVALDSNKHWLDQESPHVVGEVPTKTEAQALVERIARRFQDDGLYIGDRIVENALSVYERGASDGLTYIGAIFYLEDRA